jgi:ribonuclease HI
MKKLKLDHKLAQMVISGEKRSTWRLFDDKDLSVNDVIELVDKVNPDEPQSWKLIGAAKVSKIIEKRLGDINESDMDGHEKFGSQEAMLAAYRGYYGEHVGLDTTVKIIFFDFAPYQQGKPEDGNSKAEKSLKNAEIVKIFADGGSRGNPGPSASGYVILDMDDAVLVDKGVYLGITTNNQAEYQALKFALEEAQKMHARTVDVYMDSMLVINQMKGVFKVKNRDLWPIHDAIKKLAASFEHITFTHVPRELNKLADTAVNRALDEAIDTPQKLS